MYRILPHKFIVTVLVILGAALLALVMNLWEALTGRAIEWWQIPRTINFVALVVLVLVGLVVRVLWRPIWQLVPALNYWVFPDLNGVWCGELQSTWVDSDSGKGLDPIHGIVTVTLGWFNVSVRMQTGKMQSFSNHAFLERKRGTKIFRLWYGYQHEPTAASQSKNPPHEGMAYLEFDMAEPDRLRGQYYTSRQTIGDFKLKRSSAG